MEASSPSLTRWGAAAACLGGISYGAGYLDNPDASGSVIGVVVLVLGVTTPTLFLGGLVGLYSWLGGGGSLLQRAGLLVGLVGTVLGVFVGLDWWEGLDWWILLFAGLTAVGVGMIVEDVSRLLGTLVLVSGTLGWVSLLTDPAFSGVLVPMRQVHVAFAALFCLSCVAWGWVLFRAVSKRT
jgi:hypothetical protein